MTSQPIISVEGISKKFCSDLNRSLRYALTDSLRQLVARRKDVSDLRPSEFWALRDINFSLEAGEGLAVMGVNGAGKSTLVKLLIGSLRPTEGRVVTRGRVAALTEMGLGFNPVLTGRENAYLSASILGIDRQRIDRGFDEIVEFAGLREFIDSPLQIYSTGMKARLGFSVAMQLAPDILLVDEVLAVGDVGFQRRCMQHAKQYLAGGGTIVLVTHSPYQAQALCERSLVINHGVVAFEGNAIDGVARYFELANAADEDVEDPQGEEESRLEESAPAPVPEPNASVSDTEHESERSETPASTDAAPQTPDAGERVDTSAGEEVRILAFGVEPVEGSELTTGQPARVYLRVHARDPQSIVWGFTLWTPDRDRAVFHCSSGTERPVELPAGEGELSCVIQKLPLSGGRFAVGVGLADFETSWAFASLGYPDESDSEPPHLIDVKQPPSFMGNLEKVLGALVVVEDLRWSEPRSSAEGSPRRERSVS